MAQLPTYRDSVWGVAWGNHATTADFDIVTVAAIASHTLPIETVVTVNRNTQRRRPWRANGVRNLTKPDIQNDLQATAPTASISMPYANTCGDLIVSAVFQNVTESAAASVFDKKFEFPTSGTYPNFNGSPNEGAFFSLVGDHSPADDAAGNFDEQLITCMPTSLTLSCYPDQHEGRLWIDADCLARYYIDNVSYTGTMTTPSSWTYFPFTSIQSVNLNSLACMCGGFSVTIKHDQQPIPVPGYISSTSQNETNRVSRFFSAEGTLRVYLESISTSTPVSTIIQNIGANTVYPLSIRWANSADVDANGEAVLDANCIFHDAKPVGTEERVYDLSFECVADSTGATTQPIRWWVANNVDRGAVWSTASTFWTS